jgi:hypothetical protein
LGGKSGIEGRVILIVDLYSKTGQGKRTSKYITRWKGEGKRRGESGRSRENIIEERAYDKEKIGRSQHLSRLPSSPACISDDRPYRRAAFIFVGPI